MIKPMECPRCGRMPIEFPSATNGKIKANIACMNRFGCEPFEVSWFHHGVQAKTEKAATRKWNRWARRELRRVKKEGEKK